MTPASAVVEEPASSQDVVERRRRPRLPHVAEARLACPTARPRPRTLPADVPFCPHDTRVGTVVDRSQDGIHLVLDRAVPVGAYQKVVIEGDDGRIVGEREAKVVRCDDNGDGTWDVGAILC